MKTLTMALALILYLGTAGANAASVIQPQEWSSYLQNYVGDDGRVIDTGNGGISHSESQGYGLILSVLADDRPSFERIWSFTRTELLIRDDGLAAWRWEPENEPHVLDNNNATDGDILIAYGLTLAGDAWGNSGYTDAARSMVRTIGRTMLVEADGMPAILPGEFGFKDPSDETVPILNPSYWVFEALPVFAQLDPTINWDAVSQTGIELIRRARVTKSGLPPDWLVLDENGQVRPAPNFSAEFGYNGIRIPLYMMRAGINPVLLDPFRQHSDAEGLQKVDTVTNTRLEPIIEPGYRLIAAAMDCTVDATPIPADLMTLSATSYYAATLQLLLLDHLRRNRPDCLGETTP